MREIAVVMKELQETASDIQKKQQIKNDADKASLDAGRDLSAAQVKGAKLQDELNEVLSLLVPSSMQGRVRQTP